MDAVRRTARDGWRIHGPRRGRATRIRRSAAQASPSLDPALVGGASPEQPGSDLGEVEVAHEALIRHWPRLKDWLDEDRTALLLRESVREDAQEWEQHQREESYLAHRGRRLDDALALRQHPRLDLNALERAYLDAALDLREREEQEREAQRQRELAAQRERAELAEAARREAEQRVAEQAVAARGLRRRFLVAAALGVLALLAAGYAFYNFREAGHQRAEAEGQRILAEERGAAAVAAAETAEAERDRANRQADLARAQALSANLSPGFDGLQHEQDALLARQAYLFDRAGEGTGWDGQIYEVLKAALSPPHFNRFLSDHGSFVRSVAYSRDTTMLATGADDGTVRLFNGRLSGTPTSSIPAHAGRVDAVAFSPDGTTLASSGDDGKIQLWRVDQPGTPTRIMELIDDAASPNASDPVRVRSLAFSPVAPLLAAAGDDGMVRLWRLSEPGSEPQRLEGHQRQVYVVAFSADGAFLASGAQDSTVRIWNPATGAAERVLRANVGYVTAVAISADDRYLAAAGGPTDVDVRIWDLTTQDDRPRWTLPRETGAVRSAAFSPVSPRLATAAEDGSVTLWEIGPSDVSKPIVLNDKQGLATGVAFSPDGTVLAAAVAMTSDVGSSKTVRLWNLAPPVADLRVVDLDADEITAVAFSGNGAVLAAGHESGEVVLFNPNDPALTRSRVDGPPGRDLALAFSRTGNTWAAANGGAILIMDLGRPEVTPTRISGTDVQVRSFSSIALSGDGSLLAAGSPNGKVSLWETGPAVLIKGSWDTGQRGIRAVALSRDGQWLATGGADGSVMLWNPAIPDALPVELEGLTGPVTSLAFSPDSEAIIASGGSSQAPWVRLWELTDREHPQQLPGPSATISAVAFSSDGRAIAAAGEEGIVWIWNRNRPTSAAAQLRADGRPMTSLDFSADGNWLAAAGRNSAVLLWPTPQGLADVVCNQVGRNLSAREWDEFIGPESQRIKTCESLPLDGLAGPAPATPVS